MRETRPDYLVIGHVTKDLLPGGGSTAGGTALYSALTAQRLGLQAAIVTACSPQDDGLLDEALGAGIWVHRLACEETTTFSNRYDDMGNRVQVLSGQAQVLECADVPGKWTEASIVHLGPVAQELAADLPRHFSGCEMLGVTPQGWMRYWNGEGHVRQSAVPVPPGLLDLPSNACLVLSLEDLAYDQAHIRDYVKLAPLTALTNGPHIASICSVDGTIEVQACHANVVDPTGAGDVFATAFFVTYKRTGELRGSARFAHAAAACNIEGRGISAVPDTAKVLERLAQCREGQVAK
jgi:sugar/nucleoside kinase (ribokinase family)